VPWVASREDDNQLDRGSGMTLRDRRGIDHGLPDPKEDIMSVAKVEEISSTSQQSFEKAVEEGIARASKTLRNIRSAWVKEMRVNVRDNKITEYQVNLQVTFVLDD
jgi:dodecin